MFESIADLVDRRGWIVVLAWVALIVGLRSVAPPWDSVSKDDDVRFFPAGYPSVVGQELLVRGFPSQAASSQAVIVLERPEGTLGKDDYAYVDEMVKTLKEANARQPKLAIKQIDTYQTPVIGARLVGTSADGKGQAVLTIVSFNGTYLAKSTREAIDELEAAIDGLPKRPKGASLALTGSAVVGHDMNVASKKSIANTTYATIALVVAILLIVYRSPLLALIPLVTIALSVWASMLSIALLTKVPGLNFQVINITNIFVIVVLFGAGTDYCLFLIARYREELVRGRSRRDALREAIAQVGGALVASAGTVIVGLGMLWFSSFAKIQYTGPAIGLSLAIGLLSALTLAPVLLHWLRGSVFWPFQQPHHERGADTERETVELMPMAGFWFKVANLVVKHPIAILTACVLALLPFAIVGSQTRANYSQLADLSPNQRSVIGSRVVQRYFAVGELSPSGILIENPNLDFRADAARAAIEEFCRRIAGIGNVAEVRAISRPLGRPVEAESTGNGNFFQRLKDQAIRAAAVPRYVSTNPTNPADLNHVTRIDVVFKSDPFSYDSMQALEYVYMTLEAATRPGQPLEGVTSYGLTGATASINDLKAVTTSDQLRMYVLVTVGVYLILVILLRRPGICLYLIATVVLGYLASLGVTELVFKALHNGPEPWGGLDWKVGFFLFVILVAVGEDYNIFLMSRVIEEEAKHGVTEGTRLAVAHTGGIISSCGLIMAGTFGSMLTGSLTALRELGFALGLGVMLDTFLVRPILVPAFVVVVDRYQLRWKRPQRMSAQERQKEMKKDRPGRVADVMAASAAASAAAAAAAAEAEQEPNGPLR